MYCIENEFSVCIEAIQMQTHRNFDYFIVKDKPNKQAHDELYTTFMSFANDYDVFIKIDADMVLTRNTFFSEVISELKIQPDVDHFQIGVWDHFTDRLIFALHVFRSSVRWERNDEKYFVDLVHEPTKVRNYMDLNGPLAPAAHHCPNPSLFQAFHFGLHKAVKLSQREVNTVKIKGAKSHARNIYFIYKNYLGNRQNKALLFALLGCFWALDAKATFSEVDFSSPKALAAFENYEGKSLNVLTQNVVRLAFRHRLFLKREQWLDFATQRYTYGRDGFVALLLVVAKSLKNKLK